MFKQEDIKSTLRVDHSELQAFLCERPTLPVSYADISERLYDDVLGDLGTEDFEVIQ
jgi:hypothetical protein